MTRLVQLFKRAVRHALGVEDAPVWYSPDYRLPLPGLEGKALEPRRADLVAWHLLETGVLSPKMLRPPPRASWDDLARVHTPQYLESLTAPETLAKIFAEDPNGFPVDEVLRTTRLAAGGTIAAARAALDRRGPTLNLLGGFHHAAPDRGAGLCAVNDIAVAVAAVRAEGFDGRVAVLDLDAHPPDGTAACFAGDAKVWIGSLSGSDWGAIPGVDEVTLPPGTGDAEYLDALDRLLARMPRADLFFVVAGGDVLQGDRMGRLSLSLAGARIRDLRALRAVWGLPSVWLPGGGYTERAWRVLAGTALVLIRRSTKPIPPRADPLRSRFRWVSLSALDERKLGASPVFTEEDLGLGPPPQNPRLLGFYTAEGLEYGLSRYGILRQIERLGYRNPRVVVDQASVGDRMRVLASAAGAEHLVIELAVERRTIAGAPVLFVNWLTLRNPLARFSTLRPKLPGQEVPGLGLAREASELLALMARRLGLSGVAFRPAWYHMAYAARHRFQFVDAARQGRFVALVRDLEGVTLLEATVAVHDGRVQLNGAPYTWEADEMVFWLDGGWPDRALVAAEAARSRFVLRRG